VRYFTPTHAELDLLDELASRDVDVDAIPWTALPFAGVTGKVLLRDEHGVRTALARLEPGAELPLHEYAGLEQSYVLEGTLVDQEGECQPGDFVWPLAGRHVAHAPGGCLMLAFFKTPVASLSEAA